MNDLRNPFGRTDKLTVPVPVRSNYDSPLYVLNNFISNLLVNLPPISGKERRKNYKASTLLTIELQRPTH